MSRATAIIEFIEECCIVPDGPMVGTYVRLEPFQKKFITDVYDNPHGTRKAFLSLARRNGKTVLTACLLLAHLAGPEAKQNAQIVSGAMALKQAAVIFDYAAAIVDASPALKPVVRVTPSKRELHGLLMGTRYRSLASESETSQGLSTVLAIIDEIGQIRGPTSNWTVLINTMIPLEHAAARASREATGERPSNVMTKRPDGVRYMALRALGVREGRNPGVRQTLLVQRRFFWRHRG